MGLTTQRLLLNLLQSQVAWFACVLSAAAGRPWLGTTTALALTVVHVAGSRYKARELSLVLVAGLFGAVADSTLLRLGLLQFHSGIVAEGFSPHWMIALWMNFATVLNYSLRWLKSRAVLAGALGAVAGPLAYYAGMKFGALDIRLLPGSLAAIAAVWLIALPFLIWLSNKLDATRTAPLPRAASLFVLAATAVVFSAWMVPAKADQIQQWQFKVSLDDKPIGTHEFKLARAGDEQQLQTQAQFKVKVLGITFYTYRHENRETWRSGCLKQIQSKTDDNGKALEVRGALDERGFTVERPQPAALPSCVFTFAYWNPEFLQAKRLLNSQTGAYEAIDTQDRGTETLTVRGQPTQAQRHTLRASGYVIDVWYSSAGDWLALSSKTPEGRTLKYELQ